MLPQPTETFQFAASPSRVALLATEYERWDAFYTQICDRRDDTSADDAEGLQSLDLAGEHAVRLMKKTVEDLTMTRARTLRDLGLKARVVFDHDELEDLSRALIREMMEINDLQPIVQRDVDPKALLPGFVEPVTLPTAIERLPRVEQETCQVAEMGHRFQRAVAQYDIFDKTKNDAARDSVELIEALSEAAVLSQAKSALGALFQLVLVAGHISSTLDLVTEEHEHAQEMRHNAMLIDTGLWSIRRFIENHFGINARDIGGEYHMPERCSFSARLEGIAEDGKQQFRQAAE